MFCMGVIKGSKVVNLTSIKKGYKMTESDNAEILV